MESYSRGRRGAPAKGVGVERRARVQIPHSPPKGNHTKTLSNGVFVFSLQNCFGTIVPIDRSKIKPIKVVYEHLLNGRKII